MFGHCHMSHCYVNAGRVKKKIMNWTVIGQQKKGYPASSGFQIWDRDFPRLDTSS